MTDWQCLDALGQQWAHEIFTEGNISVREVEDKILIQRWFELRIGRETIHVPPTALGPLQDALQVMIERKL